jgi:broad specificity phosphatase PhoE
VIADADRELAVRDVIVVGHGHASRVLVARYLGLPPSAGVGFAFDPASVTVLGHERGEHRIDLLNVPGGLAEPPPPPADRH